MSSSLSFSPIGSVVGTEERVILSVAPDFRPGLAGLEEFGHVMVLWLGAQGNTESLVLPLPYRGAPPRLGVFATRAPIRPNPILVSVCRVLAVNTQEGTVAIDWIDADIGTSILDLKPYHPSLDRVRDPRVPSWCEAWPQCLEESGCFDWSSVMVS